MPRRAAGRGAPGSPKDRRSPAKGGLEFVPLLNRHVVVLLLVLLPCWCFLVAAQGAEDEDPLSALKVAFIYKLTRFIQWPQEPAGRPFVIGVIGDPVMEGQMSVLEREAKRVGDRPIEIRAYTRPESIGPSEILFVGAGAEDQIAAILRRTAGKPTLLIGDTPR